MLITVSNNVIVQNPTEDMTAWCKKELIIPNPDYLKKVRLGFWTGRATPNIYLYLNRGKELELPYGTLQMIPKEILEQAIVIDDFKKHEPVDFKADIPLYDYQEVAVEEMLKAGHGILQAPAGSGKTQMGLAIAARNSRKTLWLCHTYDLLNQSMERARMYMDEDGFGTITDGKINIGKTITFATIQTMSNIYLPLFKDEWDCLITDEVHRVSGSPTTITQYEKVLNALAAPHKYGMSATVHRADGTIKATFSLIGTVQYNIPSEVVADKIMKVGIKPIATETRMSRKALNPDGTINYARLITSITEDEARNKLIIDAIVSEKKPSLILSERLSHLENLMNNLPSDMRKDAVMISGKMTSKKGRAERNEALEDMRTGRKKYLFATYSLAKEGLDVPCLERLFMATPQKDYAVITQSIGRIARRADGKEDAIAYDFVDKIDYLVRNYKKRQTVYRKNDCYYV